MNILFTCAGRRNYLIEYFQNEISNSGGKIFATNSIEYSSALITAEKGFIVPEIHDPSYIDTLLLICKQNDINAIIPLFDIELPILAESSHRFTKVGIRVVVSSPEVIKICNDKMKTIEILSNNGILTPKTFLRLDDAIDSLRKNESKYPIIIKPRCGMGSIGILEADNELELTIFYEKVRKIIKSSYVEFASNSTLDDSIIIQEKISGLEFGLDVINDLDSNYITTIVKRKISMRAGETDIAVTENFPLLTQLGEKISNQIRHINNLDVDVLVYNNNPYVLEMNPRFGGGYPFSHIAGVNLPKALICWLNGQKADPSLFDVKFGVVGLKGVQLIKYTTDNIFNLM